MGIEQRLAQLERTRTGDDGAGVWGICRVHDLTGMGPDAVMVGTSGATMTKAAFHQRYPRGLLILRAEYGTAMDRDVAINDTIEDQEDGTAAQITRDVT